MTPFRSVAAVLLVAAFAAQASAQAKKEKEFATVVLSAYPLSFFTSTMKIGAEFALAGKTSGFLSLGVTSTERSEFFGGIDNVTEFIGEVQPRFYLSSEKKSLDGFFTAPFIGYRSMSYTRTAWTGGAVAGTTTSHQANALSIGYIIGIQALVKPGIAVGVSAGGGMGIPSGDRPREDPFNFYGRGITGRFAFWLGIAL